MTVAFHFVNVVKIITKTHASEFPDSQVIFMGEKKNKKNQKSNIRIKEPDLIQIIKIKKSAQP